MDSACVLDDVVEGIHLLVAEVGFDGVLVDVVAELLLVFDERGDVFDFEKHALGGLVGVWDCDLAYLDLEVLDVGQLIDVEAILLVAELEFAHFK